MTSKKVFALLLLIMLSFTIFGQSNYEAKWLKVDSLEKKGLYNMALNEVHQIFKIATTNKNNDNVIKSVFYELKYNSNLKEDDYILGIYNLEKLINESPSPSKEILHSITAEVYWGYYNANSWKYRERTEIESAVKLNDIRTWDLKRIAKKIIFHYSQSLNNFKLTQSLPVSNYYSIINNVKDTKNTRPKLYDFLAHRAIKFFSSNSFNLPGSAETYNIDNPKYFGSNKQFLNLNISTKDSLNTKFYASLIYKLLTDYHLRHNHSEARLMLEINRIDYVYYNTTLINKEVVYEKALLRMINDNKKNPVVSEVLFRLAKYYNEKGNNYDYPNEKNRWQKQKALKICKETIKQYPNTFGAKQCKALITEIEQKKFSFNAETALIPNQKSKILLNFTNVNTIYFKIVKYDYEQFINDNGVKTYNYLLNSNAVFKAKINLPNPNDFQNHSIEYLIPELEKGHYVFVASSSPNFDKEKEAYAYSSVWSTYITYQTKTKNNKAKVLVINRENGKPIENAKVTVKYSKYNYVTRKYDQHILGVYQTNNNGIIEFSSLTKNRSYSFKIEKNGDLFSNYNSIYLNNYKRNQTKPQIKTIFFTDRKLYRPGQTIYYKGIVYKNYNDKHKLDINKTITVNFYDVNYQLIAKSTAKTNEFGSISGEFTAPYGALTGNMTISCETGSTNFRVEEYKRPKFTTEFNPVKGEYELEDSVKITGVATAFAGNKIDGANVSYRITRTTRYNYYRWGWWYGDYGTEKEIDNGKTITNQNGEYVITFKALADKTKNPKDLPIFDYTIYADVTDINGETQSTTTTISVGYQSLLLSNNLPSKTINNKPLSITISTNNLNGQTINAKGVVKIYKLKTPKKTYKNRLWKTPDLQAWSKQEFENLFPLDEYKNENDYHTWAKEKSIFQSNFNTTDTNKINLTNFTKWDAGMYVYEAEALDKNGVVVKDVKYFEISNCCDKKPSINTVFNVNDLKTDVQPGDEAKIVLSTIEKNLNVYYTIEHKGEIVHSEWLKLSNEQKLIKIKIEEKHRGNFNVSFSTVKNNRSFSKNITIKVPYKNKQLDLSFSTFRNKLLPGEKEEWTLTIKNSKGEKEMAELLATLYDASLDELYTPNNYIMSIYQNYYRSNNWTKHRGIGQNYAKNINYKWNSSVSFPNKTYPTLNKFGYNSYYYGPSYNYYSRGGYGNGNVKLNSYALATTAVNEEPLQTIELKNTSAGSYKSTDIYLAQDSITSDDDAYFYNSNTKPLNKIKARTNFNETAFFFPQLTTDLNGDVKIKFTIPESLTKWKFLGLAHTKDLKIGNISEEVITQKELMVVPNAPRFLREGDNITLSTKISNLSNKNLTGKVMLQLIDPITNKTINDKFNLKNIEQSFTVTKGQSTNVKWHINVPYELGAVKYKIVASASNFSDGEANVLPILTNRMLVTESLPLPIRGKETKTFNFDKLLNSANSSTLKHHRYTLEFTSNPAWYAIQAMPYMMEYPHECAEQIFTRYYSNTIATHIMNSSPKIKQVITDWGKNSPEAFLSNLQKNEKLKSLLLEETPWVLDAKDEEQSKRNLSILLDINRMSNEQNKALSKIINKQSSNGGWPWFPGMKESRYITQHIISGLGHLDHLGIKEVKNNPKTWKMVKKGIQFLDSKIVEDYNNAIKYDKNYLKNKHIGYSQIQYLYARSYFPSIAMNKQTKTAIAYYKNQIKKYWLDFNIYAEGMIALAAHRMEMNNLATDVVKSLKDRAINHDEFGMYWKDYHAGFYWYQAPIETQALMIEMFNDITNDQKSVENLKIWLLKQKQTTSWKTTKQTTEAVYALLLNGSNLLKSDELVNITIGAKQIEYVSKPNKNPYKVNTEAGTGYFKTSWTGNNIKPDMGKIKVQKNSDGVAWGAVYWQYFEDLDKITYAETPLKLNKQLFIVKHTNEGEKLTEIKNSNTLKIGDKIKVRIELRTDRNLEYVHMKDMRASGFEPINVLSRYKWRDGLGYYQATKDASTNFFFDYIPKGTYVFEYNLRVQHSGNFSNGITTIQCMYAPEFTSHSKGVRVKVE